MKTDKYKDPIKREVVDDNIKIEVHDEIATDIAKLILGRRLTLLRFVMCVPRRSRAGRVFSSNLRYMKEFSINGTSAVTKLQLKSILKVPLIGIHY